MKVRFYWNPKDRLVPFIGVCWWSVGSQVIISLWPAVWYFGEGKGLSLWELRRTPLDEPS